ncbi:hypothetical protein PF005_g31178 [Phytophthora fragariae]|uniref:Uncharacterized protein n=1 Tax=Phytophthora fragariae TaxID=53985 RepID=A0A6A3VEN0_9STRA|nr:hypothetical protein PF003_g31599 [Phytophthora fragariae]KAE8918364.1 hypothetical protein PF009_g31320 [Phytophthora fragariae]KAE8959392.1 hypothetical protein PF011_g30449 [Phytophthora fragariae]KAE9091208.1 hypothetical protein PF010_g18279 [Phytophthora fragariae]KAE9094649.1 hypothetical protein PF007_g17683 [Phytophthora fragariae]
MAWCHWLLGCFWVAMLPPRGETVVDVVRIIMRSQCGVSTDNQIRLPGVIFALD